MLVEAHPNQGMKFVRYFMSLCSFWPIVLLVPSAQGTDGSSLPWILSGLLLLSSIALTKARFNTAIQNKERRSFRLKERIEYGKGLFLHQGLLGIGILISVYSHYGLVIAWLLVASQLAKQYNLFVFNPFFALMGYKVLSFSVQSGISSSETFDVLLLVHPDQDVPQNGDDIIVYRISDNVYLLQD